MKPVIIEFDGKEYRAEKEDSIWGLIEAIEDVITFLELLDGFSKKKFPVARIFRAYAAAINYMGGSVTANQVRESSSYQDMGEITAALINIMALAQPGIDLDLGDAPATKKKAARK